MVQKTSTAATPSPTLESGFRQMYNLQFAEAHQTFQAVEGAQTADPLAPASDAAAYLFAEFDRLGILQSDFFLDDENFKTRQKLLPDPRVRQDFENALARSDQLADRVLSRNPRDANALFAKVMSLGLRADYTGLIEKRYFTSLGYVKSGGKLADQLLAIDPARYDAYVAIGAENYILSLNSAPVRWALRLYGAQTDQQRGVAKLRLAAEKGRYLQPYARILLAVAALRAKNRGEARQLLAGLAQEFPNNTLYRKELARIQ